LGSKVERNVILKFVQIWNFGYIIIKFGVLMAPHLMMFLVMCF